jgi:hypothetical protein
VLYLALTGGLVWWAVVWWAVVWWAVGGGWWWCGVVW